MNQEKAFAAVLPKVARVIFLALAAVLVPGCAVRNSSTADTPGADREMDLARSAKWSPPRSSATAGNEGSRPDTRVAQVKVSSKFISTSHKPTTQDGDIMEDEAMISLMRALAQTKDTILMTAPSITMRLGQEGTIEIIREGPGDIGRTTEERLKGTVQFFGLVVSQTATLKDDGVQFELNCHYRFAPGEEHMQLTRNEPPEIPWDRLHSVRAVTSARLKSGQTVCSDFGEIEPGVYLQVFSKVEAIDATGRPIANF